MKSRLLIIAGIILLLIGITTIFFLVNSFDVQFDEKYQYQFWQQDVEFENNVWYNRVLFSYSHDYGETFSKPVDMSMTQKHAHEPKMIIMDNDVLLVWRDEVLDGIMDDISFAKSTDFGETFEKKRIFYGARPDIKQYDGVLYLTWAGSELKQIWYSDSKDLGQTFSDPILLFEIDWELNPYEVRPIPELTVNNDNVIVSWKMQNYEDGNCCIVWQAIDKGKQRNFEITQFFSQE